MVAKKTTPSPKKTTKSKPKAAHAASKPATNKRTDNKTDYYPNRVSLLTAVIGVSLLVLIALVVATY